MQKFFKVLLVIAEWGLLISLAGTIFLNYFIQNKLEKAVEDRLSHYYNLEFESITTNFHLTGFDVLVNEPQLFSNSNIEYSKNSLPILDFTAGQLKVAGISTWNLLFSEEIKIGTIQLYEPEIFWHLRDSSSREDQTSNKQDHSDSKIFAVKNIVIGKGKFKIFTDKNDSIHLFATDEFNISVDGFRLNNEMNELSNLINFKDVAANMVSAQLITPLAEFYWKMDSLSINYGQKAVKITQAERVPFEDLEEQASELEDRQMLAAFTIPRLELFGVNYDDWLRYQKVNIDKALLTSAKFNFFVSRKKEHDKTIYKRTLTELVQGINYPLNVDTVKIDDLNLKFEVMHPESNLVGHVDFTHLNGFISPFGDTTSVDTSIVYLKGGFMNNADIELTIEVPIRSLESQHHYYGCISKMPFADWNSFMGKVFPVEFKSGFINKLYFSANATAMETVGNIKIDYNDLDINIEKENGKKAFFKNLAVGLVIDKKVELGKDNSTFNFYYRRPIYKHQAYMWMGGLVDGLAKALLKGDLDKLIKGQVLPS